MKLAHETLQAKALLSGTSNDLGAGLLAIGPDVVFMGDIESVSANVWTVRLRHFLVGDAHKLIAFIDRFQKAAAQDRYVLSNELGDGRVLSGSPSLTKLGAGYTILCPVDAAFSRVDAQQLGSSSALHPETNDLYIDKKTGNIARVSGLNALPQYIKSALSMQRGESVFEPAAGMRFFEYFEEYRGSPILGSFLTLDVIRQAAIPVQSVDGSKQHTPLQCVTRVRSFELLSEIPEGNLLPVRADLEVQGIGSWQHNFSISIPTKDYMAERARLLAQRPDLRILPEV